MRVLLLLVICTPIFAQDDGVPFVGKACYSNADCPYIYATCNVTKQCDCQDGFIGSTDRKKCLQVAMNIGDKCQLEDQCSKLSNATCSEEKCQCREDYHASGNACWKNVAYGKTCDSNRDCDHFGGICNMVNHLCDCRPHEIINNRRTMCYIIAKYRGKCNESTQCAARLDAADCIQGICRCARGFHFIAYKEKCLHSKTIGQPCHDDEDCFQVSRHKNENSLVCSSKGKCACGHGYERNRFECVDLTRDNGVATNVLNTLLLPLISAIGILL